MRWVLAVVLSVAACAGGEDGDPIDSGTTVDADPPDSGCGLIEIPSTRIPVDLEEPFQLQFPAPSGALRVGTHVLFLTDPNREQRELAVQLYYPTEATGGPRAPLMEDAVAAELSTRHGLPSGFHRSIGTNAWFDVPIARGPWPVLVYSHGLNTFRHENQILFEELASQGYVVVAISHTYGSGVTVLGDGRAVPSMLPQLPPPFAPLSDWVAYFEEFRDQLSNVWVPDVHFVLDELESIAGPTCHWLAGSLDFTRVGMFGWSFGGATAMEACQSEDRCLAALDMDGTLFGDRGYASSKPLMMLMLQRDESTWDQVHSRATDRAYTVRIRDMVHFNFTNIPLVLETYVPAFDWVNAGLNGALGEARPREIFYAYVRAFFDLHLREQSAALLDGPPPYGEVLFERTFAGRNDGDLTLFGSLFAGDGLANATVSLFGTELRTTSDPEGRWLLGGAPQDGEIQILVDHPAIYPVLMPWRTGGLFAHMGNRSLAGPNAITGAAAEAGVAVQNGRGHLVAILLHAEDALELFGAEGGVVLTPSSGDGPFYLGPTGVDPALTASSDEGGVSFVFNLEEGPHDIAVARPGLECRAIEGPPLGPPGTIRAFILPDRASLMTIVCQPN